VRPHFTPLPIFFRERRVSLAYWHQPPPLFGAGRPSERDIAHAREAFLLLDHFTKIWYAWHHRQLFGDLVELPSDPRSFYACDA
jgi:hypothetical protein